MGEYLTICFLFLIDDKSIFSNYTILLKFLNFFFKFSIELFSIFFDNFYYGEISNLLCVFCVINSVFSDS
jgi:hypothetical protein